MEQNSNTQAVNIVDEMKTAYGDYALAVLVGRAVPDLYDGLKPVTRRILTGMKWLNLRPDGRFMKCARVEGEVMGKLHPHGGAYGGMVTVAQEFNNNHTLINGHGNFGSPTDNAAAPRYTECKLTEFAWDVLLDDFDICETRDNYDGSFQEPIRLETKVPTVLLNGIEGIGVGFATKIAPHNLREIAKAVELVSKKKKAEAAKLLIPDFPSGCDIVEDHEIFSQIAETGAGSVRLRAQVEEGVEERAGRAKDRVILTFTHLPFQTNTESIGQQIKNGLEQGKIAGVAEVRDESDLTGDRLVIVLKPGVESKTALPYIFQYTDLDTKFSCRSLYIDGTKPVELSPVEVVERWLEHRSGRLVVKFAHESEKLKARVHVIEGLLKALDKIDLVIKLIRESKSKAEAKSALMKDRALKLSDVQAEAVLEMRLRQLTNLDSEQLDSEHKSAKERLEVLSSLISSKEERTKYIVEEVRSVSKKYGYERKSKFIKTPAGITQAKADPDKKVVKATKTRFVKVNSEKGIVEQLKGPRGSNFVVQTDKLIFITDNGMMKKVAPTFKGPLYSEPTKVLARGTEVEFKERKYVVVFKLGGQVKAMTLKGEDIARTNSAGKQFLPEGAELIYIGENPYRVELKNKRKGFIEVSTRTAKECKPRQKGLVVCKITDLA